MRDTAVQLKRERSLYYGVALCQGAARCSTFAKRDFPSHMMVPEASRAATVVRVFIDSTSSAPIVDFLVR